MATAGSVRQGPQGHLAKKAVIALALLQILYQAGLLLKGFDFIVACLPIDDAYYYLQVAWNAPRLGFVTFDGIHRTNGLQFLWAWILIALGAVSSSKTGLLISSLCLSLVLNGLCYWPICRIGGAMGGSLFTIVLAAAWFNANLTYPNWYLSGMENSLHSLVAWILVASLIRTGRAGAPGGIRSLIGLSVLLVLNVWCRVDAAILSVILFVSVLWRERQWLRWRAALAPAAVAMAGAVIMLAGFYAMGRSPLPVSALIKADSHTLSFGLFPPLMARGFEFVTPVRYLFPGVVDITFRKVGAPLLLGALAIGVSAVALRDRNLWPASLRTTWGGFGVGGLAQLLFLSGLGTYAYYGVWYQSTYFIFCALTLAIAAEQIVRWLGDRAILRRRGLGRAALLAGLLYAAFVGGWIWARAREGSHPGNFSYTRYRIAQWIRENTRETDVLAAFNAGELAYFSERRVINLDGLVNDYRYYREVIRGGGSLADYLAANKVRYLVDYQIPVDLPEGTRIVHSLPDEEGNVFRVLELPVSDQSPRPGRGSEVPGFLD